MITAVISSESFWTAKARGEHCHAPTLNCPAIGGRSKARYPDFRKDWQFHTTPLHEHLVGYSRTMLLVLAGAIRTVLCIACANVANLLLALAAERRKEMGIRLAPRTGARAFDSADC